MKHTLYLSDIHAGYNYRDYGQRARRLDTTRESILAMAEYIDATRKSLEKVVLLGDTTEKLYPTHQYDPELAAKQLSPLGEVLRKQLIPITIIAGNNDPYYDPVAQEKIADFNHHSVLDAAQYEYRSLLGDMDWELGMTLGGVRLEEEGVEARHGHLSLPTEKRLQQWWTMNIPHEQRGEMRHLLEVTDTRELRHRILGKMYEWAARPMGLSERLSRYIDTKRTSASLAVQSNAFFGDQTRLPHTRVRIEGHFHSPGYRFNGDESLAYINTGTLTSAFLLNAREPTCTAALVSEGASQVDMLSLKRGTFKKEHSLKMR
jgi:predicted phosphodiesterase